MKMKTTTFVGLLLVLLGQNGFAQAPGEGTETHGGDLREIRLWEDAASLAQILRNQCSRIPNLLAQQGGCEGAQLGSLLAALEHGSGDEGVDVMFTSRALYANHRRVDATNEPAHRRVRIHIRRWDAMTAPEDRYALLFHEFLGALGSQADLEYVETLRLRPALAAWAPGNCTAVCLVVRLEDDLIVFQERLNGRFSALETECFQGRYTDRDVRYRMVLAHNFGTRVTPFSASTLRALGLSSARPSQFLRDLETATPLNSCL